MLDDAGVLRGLRLFRLNTKEFSGPRKILKSSGRILRGLEDSGKIL